MRIFLIFYAIIISNVIANGSQTLKNQIKYSNSSSIHQYKEIVKAKICYFYGPKGNKIISVNFDKNYNLISKSSYSWLNKKHSFIYLEDCKKKECQKYIHPHN